MMSRRIALLAGLALSMLPAFAASANEGPKVVATFSILGDITRNIGGDRIALTTLVGPDGDAHVYAPSPADARALAEAGLVIVNGLAFEGWIERLVKASGFSGVEVVASKGIDAITFEEDDDEDEHEHGHNDHGHGHGHEHEHEHEHEHSHAGHDHGAMDPHAWQSVQNVKVYAANIRDALIAADPEGRPVYEANATRYLADLDALDADIRAALATVPQNRRKIITSHDAFGYFDAAYGISFLAPQGISTEAEASARDVAALIRQIKDEGVKAVFVENITDARLIEQIARETGAAMGGTLYSDALSPPDGPAGTYIEMMRHNIKTLNAALSS